MLQKNITVVKFQVKYATIKTEEWFKVNKTYCKTALE